MAVICIICLYSYHSQLDTTREDKTPLLKKIYRYPEVSRQNCIYPGSSQAKHIIDGLINTFEERRLTPLTRNYFS